MVNARVCVVIVMSCSQKYETALRLSGGWQGKSDTRHTAPAFTLLAWRVVAFTESYASLIGTSGTTPHFTTSIQPTGLAFLTSLELPHMALDRCMTRCYYQSGFYGLCDLEFRVEWLAF